MIVVDGKLVCTWRQYGATLAVDGISDQREDLIGHIDPLPRHQSDGRKGDEGQQQSQDQDQASNHPQPFA